MGDPIDFSVERLKFVDESGLHIAMTRRFGRASAGQRVQDAVPKNFGGNVTILGALSCQGLEAVMTVEGATDAVAMTTPRFCKVPQTGAPRTAAASFSN